MKLVMFLDITKYKYSKIIVFIYHFYILSLLLQSTFSYILPALKVVFEAADFQCTSLTKHQKQYNTY
jgi:hypothetical protein